MLLNPATRLHVVTGKGGTGKTTVAGALALAIAERGGRVLITEVEGRQGLGPLFGAGTLPAKETRVTRTESGGEVYVLPVDAEAAFIEYLELFYHLGRAARLLQRIGAVDFVTTIAPGLRDVLLIGKVKEAAVRRSGGWHFYDAVILDAPPTGRIVRFLSATDEVAQIAKVGPIRTQSENVMTLLRSTQTAVHLVTLLEDMPVQETRDGAAELQAAGLAVGTIVVNKVRVDHLSTSDRAAAAQHALDLNAVSDALHSVALDVGPDVVKVLASEAAEHAQRGALQDEARTDLGALGRPLVDLPLLPETMDLGTLGVLADRLCTAAAAGLGSPLRGGGGVMPPGDVAVDTS